MNFSIAKGVSFLDIRHIIVTSLPEPDGDGQADQDKMRGIAWDIRGARFIDVAKIHAAIKKRLGIRVKNPIARRLATHPRR